MPSGIPAQGLSACDVCGSRRHPLPVFPAAPMRTCTAIPQQAEGALNLLTPCARVLGRLSLNMWPGHRQRCASDKCGLANRTCQVWPTVGAGREDNSRATGTHRPTGTVWNAGSWRCVAVDGELLQSCLLETPACLYEAVSFYSPWKVVCPGFHTVLAPSCTSIHHTGGQRGLACPGHCQF